MREETVEQINKRINKRLKKERKEKLKGLDEVSQLIKKIKSLD